MERPPYRAAAAVVFLVWLGYLLTLAPTVTLWDAGEFIVAAHTLGIPHPPGTPLFVLLGNVWGKVLALGEYAWRLNLMSATFSAAAAGCLFLVLHEVLRGEERVLRLGSAAAGALLAAFTFTAWQNSNETEVYMVATFSIAAIAWLCLRWRAARGTPRAPHLLLLVVYLLALSIGNHLMALLVGPAVVAFLWHALRTSPASTPVERQSEWSEAGAVATIWVVLVGTGLGSTRLIVVGGVLFALALVFAVKARAPVFPLVTVAVAAVGVSTYAFLYIRSGLDPALDMADPETWDRLLSVIRREQYPARGLFDDPRFLPGPENPGRSAALFVQQFANYLQYFDWQWAASIARWETAGLTGRLPITLLFAALGVQGLRFLRERDRSVFTLLFMLWLITGVGLVLYMNFKPGFSLFWDQYRTMDDHEVRERDYFFTMSFQVWGLFAGLGLARAAQRLSAIRPRSGLALPALALLPIALNASAASRRHGPEAMLARDWAWDMLQSVEPYGVLFTYGDNDTYPLWYAQEVEGVRRDVQMMNLSLANTEWHLRFVRDRSPAPYDSANGPPVYAQRVPPRPPEGPLFELSDSVIEQLRGMRLDRDVTVEAGGTELRIPAGTVLYPRDQAILLVLSKWLGTRPVAFGLSSSGATTLPLEQLLVLQGLAAHVKPERPGPSADVAPGLQGMLVDLRVTEALVERPFRYAKLFEADTLELDPSSRSIAGSLAIPFLELAQAYAMRGDQAKTLAYFRKANHLAPNDAVAAVIRDIESVGLEGVLRRGAGPPN